MIAFNQVIGKMADDSAARLLRARAYLARNDSANAMLDLNYVLSFAPGNADALTLRGIVRSSMHDYDAALADLNQALGKKETVEAYFARAKLQESRGDAPHATADFRRATELKPTSLFDLIAQAESKKQIQQLSKQVPCGSAGGTGSTGTCL